MPKTKTRITLAGKRGWICAQLPCAFLEQIVGMAREGKALVVCCLFGNTISLLDIRWRVKNEVAKSRDQAAKYLLGFARAAKKDFKSKANIY
jgi:hypothetical protein